MTSIRGLSINDIGIPITNGSYQVQRNLITEDAATIPGEPAIYGGIYTISGSFSAAYRPQLLNQFIENGILGKIGGGVSETFEHYNLTIGDEFDKSLTFASCALTSCEITMEPGQYSKCNFDWIGTYKKKSDLKVEPANYTYEPCLFYNAKIDKIKCRGITFILQRPLSAEDCILGSEYSQTLVQTDNLTIGGTITLSNRDYDLMDKILYTTDEDDWNNDNPKNNVTKFGELEITFRNPSGSKDLCKIFIDEVHLQDLSVSVEGLQRFNKTIEWKAISDLNKGIKFELNP